MTMSNQHQRPNYQPHQQYPDYQRPAAPPPKKKSSAWTWIFSTLGAMLAALVILAILFPPDEQPTSSSSGATGTPAPASAAAPAKPAKPAGPARTMGNGVYQVGVDVQAGRYKTSGPPADSPIPSCYWARASNDSGEFEAIIANGNIEGPGSVSVKRGEFVELNGGCAWTKVG